MLIIILELLFIVILTLFLKENGVKKVDIIVFMALVMQSVILFIYLAENHHRNITTRKEKITIWLQ